ncbi:MAG TPA: hypothetical protein V6D03_16625 [Candidatus Caenarcaniphilales bacterium]
MRVLLCPGMHDPGLTTSFVTQLQAASESQFWVNKTHTQQLLIFPSQAAPAYSAVHVLEFLKTHSHLQTPLGLICFSAGVVGGIGAAWGWQQLGGTITTLIALDGWGVPLYGSFPIHRLSHDHFTHWSSGLLGGGTDSFYAAPAVEHLALWRSPQSILGWRVQQDQQECTTAAIFINQLLERYDRPSFC